MAYLHHEISRPEAPGTPPENSPARPERARDLSRTQAGPHGPAQGDTPPVSGQGPTPGDAPQKKADPAPDVPHQSGETRLEGRDPTAPVRKNDRLVSHTEDADTDAPASGRHGPFQGLRDLATQAKQQLGISIGLGTAVLALEAGAIRMAKERYTPRLAAAIKAAQQRRGKDNEQVSGGNRYAEVEGFYNEFITNKQREREKQFRKKHGREPTERERDQITDELTKKDPIESFFPGGKNAPRRGAKAQQDALGARVVSFPGSLKPDQLQPRRYQSDGGLASYEVPQHPIHADESRWGA